MTRRKATRRTVTRAMTSQEALTRDSTTIVTINGGRTIMASLSGMAYDQLKA
jgi:hypothetical protein